ncbi:MAG: hypothetical protein GX610_13765 [Rhodococcus sp.]|nr:hypothetical protein [Rhodococcus sp. (in: high G+C Gram-positive bacteria)]
MSRLPGVAVVTTLAVAVLAGCATDPPELSGHSLAEFCERPEQFLTDVWHFPKPVTGEPTFTDKDHPGKVGYGSGCAFAANGDRIATLGLIREVRGIGEPPNDADSIYLDDQTVKTWAVDSATLSFETAMGGWQATITVTSGADLDTREPAATDTQMNATAHELIDILAEFKGPDRTPRACLL